MSIAQLISFYKHIISSLKHLISPPTCSYCTAFLDTRAVFCGVCYETISPIVSYMLPITKKYQLKVFAVSAYREPIKSLILAKRRSNIIASFELAQLIYELSTIKYETINCLVPIPLYWWRKARRGFNQSEEIAKRLAHNLEVPVVQLLARVRHTDYQTNLTREHRIKNVDNAFKLKQTDCEYKGKHIMIVDDVMTSGATLHAAARALLPLKPASISAIVACRVIP